MFKPYLRFLYTVICILFFSTSYAQNETFAFKDWEKDSILKVEDFKGTPDPYSPLPALVTIQISPYILGIANDSITYELVVEFDKFGSWAKEKNHPEKFLGYEQMVYDIEEVYARIIRKEMLKIDYTKDNRTDIMDSLAKEYETGKCYNEIDKYNEETNGNTDTTEARKWDLRVREQLDSLSAYRNPIVRIKNN